jgi:hypothetical protein
MLLGGVLTASGLGVGWLFKDSAIVDFASLAVQLGALTLVLLGSFLLITGHDLRTAEHLPRLLTTQSVDKAAHLLEITKENQRGVGSSLAAQVSRALLIADAAVLLFLVAPMVLPSAAPFWQLCVVAAGALLIGKLANDAASAMAVAIRRGNLLAYHDAKATEGTAEGDETAAALRDTFDQAVGGRWLRRPGFWAKYGAALPGALFLLAVAGILLGLRLVLGGEIDVLALVAVALLMAGTSAVAVALRTHGECLVPEIARAKRIVARFRSGQYFEQEMSADREGLRMGLIRARQVLRNAVSPTRHAVSSTELDFEELGHIDLTAPATSTKPSSSEPASPHAASPNAPISEAGAALRRFQPIVVGDALAEAPKD